MMCRYIFCYFVTAAIGLLGLSCLRQSGENYDVDKTSPSGVYRVKIEIRAVEDKDTPRGYSELGKYQFFKGQETIHTAQWRNPDQYELTFRQSSPIIEWVDDNVVRMGQDRSDQPFLDELIVSNSTDQYLKYVSVSYGKYESFWAFDLAPNSQVILRASPRFKPDRSSNYFLGYGGMTQSKRRFQGTLERTQRKSPADGPLQFQITINAKDLQ